MKMRFAGAKGFRVVTHNQVGDRKPVALLQLLNDDGSHSTPPLVLVVVEDPTQTEDHKFGTLGLPSGAVA